MMVALTVDDGWIKVAFDSMLDMLAEHNVRATFFLILRAANNLGPERMQRLAAEGHEIGYHSSNHDLLNELMLWGSSEWAQDYDVWLEGMRSLLGEEAFKQTIRPYARAPYGLFNAAFLRMTEEKGLLPVSWSVDTGDQVSKVRFRHGDIFMLHVSTIEARILDEALSREEIRFGALSEFLPPSSPGVVLKRIPGE
jgi:peptidoglycan/xylan/chitin deacetylase (PgdA/CDA1 family)